MDFLFRGWNFFDLLRTPLGEKIFMEYSEAKVSDFAAVSSWETMATAGDCSFKWQRNKHRSIWLEHTRVFFQPAQVFLDSRFFVIVNFNLPPIWKSSDGVRSSFASWPERVPYTWEQYLMVYKPYKRVKIHRNLANFTTTRGRVKADVQVTIQENHCLGVTKTCWICIN